MCRPFDTHKPRAYRFNGRLSIDGKELPGLRSLTLKASVDALPLCSAEIVATEGMEFETTADVIVTVTLDQGCHLEQTIGREGQRVWRVVRDECFAGIGTAGPVEDTVDVSVELSPWVQHRAWCAYVDRAGGCSCGLQQTLAIIRARRARDGAQHKSGVPANGHA